MNYSFKPTLHTNPFNAEASQHGGLDFFQRMEFQKHKTEMKMEEIRNRNVDPAAKEYTFKPQVSELASSMRRDLNDLYVISYYLIYRIGKIKKMKLSKENKSRKKIWK